MSSPELLSLLGFRRRKLGTDDKELGYEIGGASLGRLILWGALAVAVLCGLTAWSQFEVRLERRSFHRRLRREEQDAAARLSQVEMELWAHFREDVRESRQARELMDTLNSSYDVLGSRLQTTIGKMARNFGLPEDKASILADATISVMAEQRQESVRHARELLSHLLQRDPSPGTPARAADRSAAEEQKQELDQLVEGFWQAHGAFRRHFGDAARELSAAGPPAELLELKVALAESAPGEQADMAGAFYKAAASLGLDLDHPDLAFLTTPAELVELAAALPEFPDQELSDLEALRAGGAEDPYALLAHLHTWRLEGRLPAVWLEHALGKAP